METLFRILLRVSKILNYIGGAALTFMMFLTVADVLLRAGGRPILGTYELVSLTLAIVIGFTYPQGLIGPRARVHGNPAGEALQER